MSTPAKNIFLIILVIFATGLGTLYVVTHTNTMGYDDAFISFRYSQNLAQGEGLVFNRGERVEGYSNLLYVLMIAPFTMVLSEDGIYPVGVILNIIALSGAAFLLARFPKVPGTHPWRWSAAFLVALNPLIWHAAWSAMETGLVVLGFVGLWYGVVSTERAATARNLFLLVFFVAFSVLIRADGFILSGVAIAYLGLKGKWRGFIAGGGAIAVFFGGQIAWRLSYYGYPLPNTYYAKVSGSISQRLEYAWRMFQGLDVLYPTMVICGGAVAVWAVVFITQRRNPIRTLTFEVWFIPVWVAYWFYVGGDMFFHRFLLVLVPVAAYVVGYRFAPIVERRVVVLALAAFFLYMPAQGERIMSDDIKHDTWIDLGRHFRQHFPGETIAVDGAGKMPYYSGARTIDTLGLNDLHIARMEPEVFVPGHNKHDFDYVLEQRPGIIAGWFAVPTLDLGAHLPRSLYREHGYEIAYAVYLLHGSAAEGPFVDVRGMSEEDIRDLQFRGYNYAVLLREDLMDF